MEALPGISQTAAGFTVTELGFIHMLGARTAEFYHSFSGARLLYIQNNDRELGFNLIYRTPQSDETDANHILEHLLLSSCGKYPSRDIFFDMDSKSYSTYMNGLTDNTFTCYPICTQSQEQLLKLMDVYLCCMEDPDGVKDENYFLREGLRLELEHPHGPLSMHGTVLSEDFGHLTDILEQADSAAAKALYPDLPASNLLGRLHLNYRELTFERVQRAYEQCYHYSNCLIVLYGDMDYRAVLTFLDREHLSRWKDEGRSLLSAMNQPPEPGCRRLTVKSPAYEGSLGKQAGVIDYALDLTGSTQEDLVYWDLFADILDNDASPIHRCIRESGIHNAMEVYLDLLLPNPSLRFRLRNGDEGQMEAFRRSVRSALREIQAQGIAGDLTRAAMKNNLLSDSLTREGAHLGYNMSEEIGRYWSQTGETGYFQLYEKAAGRFAGDGDQSIIKRLAGLALNPFASALTAAVPCPGMAEALEEEKEEYLRQTLAAMTMEERTALCGQTAAFGKWNAMDWGNTDFLIRPQDLPSPSPGPSFYKKQFGPMTCYTSPGATDGVGRYVIHFDLSFVPQSLLPYLFLYQLMLTEVDTGRYTVEQQKTMEQEYLHGCTFDEHFPGIGTKADSYPMMSVSWFGLTEDFPKSLDFLLDVMGDGRYEQSSAILDVVEKYLPDYDLSRADMSPSLSFCLAEGYIREECRFRNTVNSQEVYYFLKDVVKRLGDEPGFGPQVAGALRNVAAAILQGRRIVFMAAAREAALEGVEMEAVRRLGLEAAGRAAAADMNAPYILPHQNRRLAVCVDAPSQETRMIGDFLGSGEFKGRYLPFLIACADKYLKPALRYQGQAYDSGIDFFIAAGYFTLWSTADPQVKSTIKLFSNAGNAIRDIPLSQQDLDGYILSAYAQAMPPGGTLDTHIRYMIRDLAGLDTEQINLMTADIKNARLEDQAMASRVIQALLDRGPVVTVGNKREIRKSQECFDEILYYET